MNPVEAQAERELLGCCLIAAEYAGRAVAAGVKPEAFADTGLSAAFATAAACAASVGAEASILVAVAQALHASGTGADFATLTSCANELRNPAAQFPEALRCVLDAWTRRRTANALTSALGALKGGMAPLEVIESVHARLHEVRQGQDSGRFRSMDAIVQNVVDDLDARLAGRDQGAVCGWNVPTLDRNLRPLRRGELILVGGRPGVGKSALASWVALHAAIAGRRCAFFSLEMPAEDVVTRMAEQVARVCVESLKTAPHDHREKFARGLSQVRAIGDGLVIVDCERTLQGILSRADLVRTRDALDLLVVDYAQRVDVPVVKGQLRDAAIGQVSAALKSYAMRHHVAVLLVVALNRASETDDRDPRLSDLRESGQLEYDCDVAALLHRPQTNGSAASEGDSIGLRIAVPKNRGGRIGAAECTFHGPTKGFSA